MKGGLCRQYSGASSLPEVVPSSSWEIRPEDIVIAKHSDGSDWEIGSGGFGKVHPIACPICMAAMLCLQRL